MARREDIVNTIWDDLEHLSDDAFMLYVWSWTNTKCGMAGIYRIARHKLVEGRFDDDRLTAALAECEGDGLLRYVDGVLWNIARVKRLSGISKNYAKSIVRDLREVEGNPLVADFLARYGGHEKIVEELQEQGFANPSGTHGTHAEPLAKGSNQDGSTEPNLEPLPMGSPTHHGHGPGQGHGSGSSVVVPENLTSVFSALERVAFARNRPSAKPDAVIRACEHFARLEHLFADEAERFAAYWIDGPGSKESMAEIAWHWRNWLGNVKPDATPKVTKALTGKRDRSRYDQMVEAAS